jgi:chromate reductase
MSKLQIGVVVGSARKNSYSRKIAAAVCERMPGAFEMRMMNIENLPMYNQDYDDEGRTPAEWSGFREAVKSLDGVLLVTPEYNRSFPPLLKNALDIASRPYGQNAWSGKPGAIISVSPGKMGAFGANQHLRQVTAFLNIPLMQQVEAYIGEAAPLFNEQGTLVNESTGKFLADYAAAFAAWVEKIRG